MVKPYMVQFDPAIAGRHPGTLSVLQWFRYEHLSENLQEVAQVFADLAIDLVVMYPDGPDLTAALRDLLRAKDGAVRCAVLLHHQQNEITPDQTIGPAAK